jgi:hypothetical protein
MKTRTKQNEANVRNWLRAFFRSTAPGHNPWLVLNISLFNFSGGGSHRFENHEDMQFAPN